jgi:hypothetical protein
VDKHVDRAPIRSYGTVKPLEKIGKVGDGNIEMTVVVEICGINIKRRSSTGDGRAGNKVAGAIPQVRPHQVCVCSQIRQCEIGLAIFVEIADGSASDTQGDLRCLVEVTSAVSQQHHNIWSAAGQDEIQLSVAINVLNHDFSDRYYRFDFNLTRTISVPKHEQWRAELRADFFNLLNHTNFLLFNANDVLHVLSVPQPGTANFVNCTLCLDPFTGQYHGANGQPIKLADLQRGRVSPKTALGSVFGGLGDPAVADIARQMQLSIHVRW